MPFFHLDFSLPLSSSHCVCVMIWASNCLIFVMYTVSLSIWDKRPESCLFNEIALKMAFNKHTHRTIRNQHEVRLTQFCMWSSKERVDTHLLIQHNFLVYLMYSEMNLHWKVKVKFFQPVHYQPQYLFSSIFWLRNKILQFKNSPNLIKVGSSNLELISGIMMTLKATRESCLHQSERFEIIHTHTRIPSGMFARFITFHLCTLDWNTNVGYA